MAEKTVADVLVSSLENAGVKRIYGLIGDSLNPIGDAVRRNKHIKWISVRHEETAAFAAGAEAFLTGELCVCAGSCGPGSIHLINGLYEANRNQVPVLALATQFETGEIGLDYFQATNPMIAMKDCSIFCETLTDIGQMPRLLQEAMQTAFSKSGVSVLIVPKNISEWVMPSAVSPYLRPVVRSETDKSPDSEDIKKLADIINGHDRVTLYCGFGCKKDKDAVLALADKLNAPILHTIRSKEFMQCDNPNDVGINGQLGMSESSTALTTCDLLVLLGTDYPFETGIPTKPDIVQIDRCGKHLGRRSKLNFGIESDIGTALEMLLPQIVEKTDETHLRNALKHKNTVEAEKTELLDSFKDHTPLRPEYLTRLISQTAAENAVFTVDVGLNDVWVARYLDAMKERRIFGSFKHGTMGAAVPDAIGARLALPDDVPVIALAGDGGLTMLMGELLTIVQLNLDIKVIVYNNSELGYIVFEAENERIPPFQTVLKNPDFAKMAEIIGFKTYHVDSPKNLALTLKDALAQSGPVLIDAVTDSAALP